MIDSLFSDSGMLFVFKLLILFCIGLFTVFSLFLVTYIHSLTKIIIIKDIAGSAFIYTIAIGYVVACASLFLLALVIL